ncbi:MAG: hypothetical protein ABFC62_03670 [Clostridiaceae bacterium]|nr:hypothetical protein [Eubacteriales bacterium]
MEAYKKVITRRIALLIVPVLAAAALGVYDVFFAKDIPESFVHSFQIGAFTALGLPAAALILRYRLLLRDEKRLQREFNRENDERYKATRARAGMPMLLFISAAMIVAGVIAGYFDKTVFIALILAAACQLVIGGVVKLICTMRM